MSEAPLPERDWPLTQPFWDAAQQERFVMPRCGGCARHVWYPEERCPHCDRPDLSWVRVSGRGQLFSWAEVHHPLHPPYEDLLPYISGLVTLEEDPRIRYVTRIVDCSSDSLVIGMPMEVVFLTLTFKDVEGEVLAPAFRPARTGSPDREFPS